MTDKVLSEGEMDALMEGVSSGKVEVQTGTGPQSADVRPFEIHPRNVLRSGSFPELQRINDGLAEYLQKFFHKSLQWPVSCDLRSQTRTTLGEINEKYSGLQLASAFVLPPLHGPGMLLVDGPTLSALVEKFFGSPVVGAHIPDRDAFSTGELRVAQRFADEVLLGMRRAWENVLEINPEFVQIEQAVARVKLGAAKEEAVLSEFQIDADTFSGELAVVLPLKTLGPLGDLLDGCARCSDEAQNAAWAETFREHLAETEIPIDALTASITISIDSITDLGAGQVLPIAAPRALTLLSGGVPLLIGEFGTYRDHCCVRNRGWALPSAERIKRMQSHG